MPFTHLLMDTGAVSDSSLIQTVLQWARALLDIYQKWRLNSWDVCSFNTFACCQVSSREVLPIPCHQQGRRVLCFISPSSCFFAFLPAWQVWDGILLGLCFALPWLLVKVSLHMFIGHSCFLLCELVVLLFCPFLYCVLFVESFCIFWILHCIYLLLINRSFTF